MSSRFSIPTAAHEQNGDGAIKNTRRRGYMLQQHAPGSQHSRSVNQTRRSQHCRTLRSECAPSLSQEVSPLRQTRRTHHCRTVQSDSINNALPYPIRRRGRHSPPSTRKNIAGPTGTYGDSDDEDDNFQAPGAVGYTYDEWEGGQESGVYNTGT